MTAQSGSQADREAHRRPGRSEKATDWPGVHAETGQPQAPTLGDPRSAILGREGTRRAADGRLFPNYSVRLTPRKGQRRPNPLCPRSCQPAPSRSRPESPQRPCRRLGLVAASARGGGGGARATPAAHTGLGGGLTALASRSRARTPGGIGRRAAVDNSLWVLLRRWPW